MHRDAQPPPNNGGLADYEKCERSDRLVHAENGLATWQFVVQIPAGRLM